MLLRQQHKFSWEGFITLKMYLDPKYVTDYAGL
jgi:hypothetical protein